MDSELKLKNSKILVTGGAGFIGSNLIEYFLKSNNEVICLDNLSTGHKRNIVDFFDHPNFQFVEGDIRDIECCRRSVRDCEYVFHQAALGSVPRSITDPITTNAVNIDGFLNVLTVAQNEQVKRFIYAASSSTYGDSKDIPKVENRIGRPLSPYAITKVVNEYFAKVYSDLHGMETIGLRYFNVFGKRQDPNGAYSAVIPLWVKKLIKHESPIINGDGEYSRDFTYIDNVIQANELAAVTSKDTLLERLKKYDQSIPKDSNVLYEVFNVAFGQRLTLNNLFLQLRNELSKLDPEISKINPIYGPKRLGDVPHSLAAIEKANAILNYIPKVDPKEGFARATKWYYEYFK